MLVERDVIVRARDGTALSADVYRPERSRPVPAVLGRTPYDKSRGLTPLAILDPERAVEAGFALVCQDVRGQHASKGDFYPFRSEAEDGVDTIEWIAGQDWSSGAVGMAGRSYTAATQWLAAGASPPALRAIAPVVTGSNFYTGWIYQGGAFQLGFNLFWVQLMTGGRGKLDEAFAHLPLGEAPLLDESPAGPFYRDWLAHPTYDEFWSRIAIDRSYGRVQVPALCVGGWYDLFLGGTIENFERMRHEGGSEAARSGTRLIVGPWAHGSTFGAYPDHSYDAFGGADACDLDGELLAFFGRHLEGDEGGEQAPVRIFVMGENAWRDEDAWPLARAREETWYLRAGGRLSPEPPADDQPAEYDYDPADPAPTLGGPTSLPARFMRTNSGPLDQRKVEERPDVLVYSSKPLDRPVEVTGALKLVLRAATTAPDTDFVAKLCDVQPDGFSRILAEGVLRARFRNGFERPEAVAPGAVAAYEIDLFATSNVFLPGHRIRVSITSSSFPRFDRNPNTGAELGADRPEDLRRARQTVFHDSGRASYVLLPVVPR